MSNILNTTLPEVQVLPLKEAALDYARRGIAIFPCIAGEKVPALSNGFHGASSDPAQVEAWWDADPSFNIAFQPQLQGWAIIDVDSYAGGDEGLAQAELDMGITLPQTFEVTSARGGRHLYFKGDLPPSQNKMGKHVDTRGGGSYALLPPSRFAGGEYRVTNNAPVALLPPEIPQLLRDRSKAKWEAGDIDIDLPENISRATRYLDSLIKGKKFAKEGDMGDTVTFATACELMNIGLSEEKTLELMSGAWNAACEPPWALEELAIKVANAAAYAENEPGSWGAAPVQEVMGPQLARLQAAMANDAAAQASDYPPPLSGAELSVGVFARPTYLIKDFLLKQHVNLLYGDGGTGKTLVSLHMAVAVASGTRLWGKPTEQSPVLLVLAEDDYGETKARLAAICTMLGQRLEDLPLKTWCLPGRDLTLADVSDDGQWTPGAFLEPLRQRLADEGACLLVLDTVTDIANLDENKKAPVNALCKRVLGALCQELGATVLVNCHPSKASMLSGENYAGSVAWNNAVRNRLLLEWPDKSHSKRILSVAKANYGSDARIDLFQIGPTFSDAVTSNQTPGEVRAKVLKVALDLIDRGIGIVRTHGSGQKPEGVAQEVRKLGLHISGKEVLDHLNALERSGDLAYRESDKKVRGAKAGFTRGPRQPVGNPVGNMSDTVSEGCRDV